GSCRSLDDAIAQASHVMQQEVGVRMEHNVVECAHLAWASNERRRVTVGAANGKEDEFAAFCLLCNRSSCWWSKHAHVIGKLLNVPILVIDARKRIVRQSAAITLRAILVGEHLTSDAHLVQVGVARE